MNRNPSTISDQVKPEPKTFTTIDGNSLMAREFEPLGFSVEKILPFGLFILAGSPKIGKSWLSLDLCQAVATGGMLWNFATAQGDVLYLALEDNDNRLQSRLKMMEVENLDISRLHMATASFGLQDGLLEQICNFIQTHNETRLVVIDTLEHVRNNAYDKNMYACDYRDMTKLREITDKHRLTLMLIHHTRKMYDPDPLNTISGSTGLVGAVDGVFVLEKALRTNTEGKLTISNRDTEGFCFKLNFDNATCRWRLLDPNGEIDHDDNPLCIMIDGFLKDCWRGTATELCNVLKKHSNDFDYTPLTITREVKSKSSLLSKQYGITVRFERDQNKRTLYLLRDKKVEQSVE